MIIRKAILFLLCWFCFSGIAAAELKSTDLPDRQGLKLGDIILHGAFKAGEELETNVFLADHGEKFDAITILNPSVGIEIPFRKHKLSVDYDAAIFLYGTYHTEDHVDHRVRGLAEINFTDYKIVVKDTFRDFTDRAADENSRRIGRQYNDLNANIGAEFDQLGFNLGYTNLIETYSQKDDLVYQSVTYGNKDRISNIVEGTISYRIFPKTTIFAEGDLGFLHYYNSSLPPDSYFIDALVGVKGKITNKILANIKGGFRYQHYDNSDVFDDKPFIGPVISGGIDYLMTKDDIFNLGLLRTVYESVYNKMNYYNVNLATLKYTHNFTKKISISPYGAYQLNLYPGETTESGVTAKRHDNIFTGGCILRYDIRKWAALEAKYEYAQKASKFSTFDYIDNRIVFNGTVGF